jgi:hypothetical protein
MNTFNMSRFLKFFSNEWKMTAKQTGLLWGALILFAFLSCLLDKEERYGIELGTWMFLSMTLFFCVAQGFYISIQLGGFASKVRKTALLLQPISKTEFMTAKMISCFVLFPLLYVAFVALVAWLISCYNLAHVDSIYLDGKTIGTFKYWKNGIMLASMIWPCATATYWTGAFYFSKFAAVKSALTVLALYALLTGFSYLLFGLCSGHWDTVTFPLMDYGSKAGGYWVANYAWPCFSEVILPVGSVIFVVISVFKFKEKTL